jgi:hypothetical protein
MSTLPPIQMKEGPFAICDLRAIVAIAICEQSQKLSSYTFLHEAQAFGLTLSSSLITITCHSQLTTTYNLQLTTHNSPLALRELLKLSTTL